MVFNCPDRDIKPDRDLLLRQALHLAKHKDLGALGRQRSNCLGEEPDPFTTVDDILNRSLTAIF